MFDWYINPFGRVATDVPILRDAFPDWASDEGIFDALADLTGVTLPWDGVVDSVELNFDYFGNHSGGKFCAPAVMTLLDENREVPDAARTLLAKVIWAKFAEPWQHLWETNVVTYNPIHNYDMSDTRTLTRGETGIQSDVRSYNDTITHGRTSESKDYVYGMNTEAEGGKPSDRTFVEDGGTTEEEVSDNNVKNTAREGSEVETTRRSGNIGVTTTQQMLTSERLLWKWNYFDQIYRDIDSVLSLPIYDACRV